MLVSVLRRVVHLIVEETADIEEQLEWQLRWYHCLCFQAHDEAIREEAAGIKE